MFHAVNRLPTRCTTSMACLLLSYRSSQEARDSLYSDVPVTDQHFGGGVHIYISNNAATNRNSYGYCGNTYHPPPPGYSVSGSSSRFYA